MYMLTIQRPTSSRSRHRLDGLAILLVVEKTLSSVVIVQMTYNGRQIYDELVFVICNHVRFQLLPVPTLARCRGTHGRGVGGAGSAACMGAGGVRALGELGVHGG